MLACYHAKLRWWARWTFCLLVISMLALACWLVFGSNHRPHRAVSMAVDSCLSRFVMFAFMLLIQMETLPIGVGELLQLIHLSISFSYFDFPAQFPRLSVWPALCSVQSCYCTEVGYCVYNYTKDHPHTDLQSYLYVYFAVKHICGCIKSQIIISFSN